MKSEKRKSDAAMAAWTFKTSTTDWVFLTEIAATPTKHSTTNFNNMFCRWAQRLAGLDFLPQSSLDTVAANANGDASAAAASGAILAGLAEYRQQQRAEKFLEELKAARQAASPQK